MSTPEPVAWVAFAADGSESGVTALNREAVEEVAVKLGWHVAPLYVHPHRRGAGGRGLGGLRCREVVRTHGSRHAAGAAGADDPASTPQVPRK